MTRECEGAAQSDELTGTHSRVKPGLRCRGGLLSFIFGDIFLSQFLDCDHGECQFYGMQGFSSPLFLFSAAAVCIGIGLSETDPALLSLLLNDFLSASSKEPPPPRHLFALPPKGKIDTY